MPELNLADRHMCFVIAEAGTCHAAPTRAQAFERAIDYVYAAAGASADAIKFQWFVDGEPLFCPYEGDEDRWPRWRMSMLSLQDWAEVKRTAEMRGLVFLASAFQKETVAWLKELDVMATKVASRAATAFPYDDALAPFLISTGLPDWPQRDDAVYLECEARYPSTACWLGTHDGFSDHSGDPWRAIDAIAQGCRVVELHYHDHARDAGPDYPASLDLDQLRLVCQARDQLTEIRQRKMIAQREVLRQSA